MTDYELDLLDALIKDSETDEFWFRRMVRIFIFLAAFFFAWMFWALTKTFPNFHEYFQALATGATTIVCAVPYKSLSAARHDRVYYTWMKTQWQSARAKDDMPTIEKLRSEFEEVRKKNFGKGLGSSS